MQSQIQPLLLTKKKAMAIIGVGKDLFDAIEPNLPFVRLKKAKRYSYEDIKREIDNLRRSPCIPYHNKTKKTQIVSTPRFLSLDWEGLDEVAKQTTGAKQTSTHLDYTTN